MTEAVHKNSGRMFLQLWHVGRVSHPIFQPDGEIPIAPSPIAPAGEIQTPEGPKPYITPRPLETDEIPALVEQFRVGAKNAMAAGFDGGEIHSANGYLLDQFLRDGTNARTDRYGGSLENQVRFLMEVAGAVTAAWGADRVGVRISPLNPFNDMYDSNPEKTFGFVAKRLGRLGLAYLHVMEIGIGPTRRPSPPFDVKKLRLRFKGPYMVNGGYDRERAETTIRKGEADLVAFGVPFIANPDLVERFAKGAPLNAPNRGTFYGGDERRYTDYPFLAGAGR